MEQAVKFLGKVDDELLTHSYAAADVLLFPLVETVGDVEGFGLVAIEAAACGTPTVAFAVGGVTDAISEGVSGHLVAPGDYDAFRESVISVLNAPRRPQLAIDFAEGFAWEHYHKRLQDILVANVSGAAPHLSEG